MSSPALLNKPLGCIPPVLLNSDWFFCKIFGDWIIISFVIFGSEGLVLFFFIISNASKDDLPQTPQDELVRKSFLIFDILTFWELLSEAKILFWILYCFLYEFAGASGWASGQVF